MDNSSGNKLGINEGIGIVTTILKHAPVHVVVEARWFISMCFFFEDSENGFSRFITMLEKALTGR